MSNELATKNENAGTLLPLDQLGVTTEMSTQVESLTKSSDFLPQIRVYGSESAIVKRGQFPMGHFGLYFSSERILDLGTQFDCVVVAFRPRTSIVSGDQPVSFYDVNSKEFQSMKDLALAREQGYLAGLEYLIWIPEVGKFGLFFMGNPTLRRESANVQAAVGKAVTLKIKLIETKQYTWHGAQCLRCDAQLAIPSLDVLKTEVDKFKNPPTSVVEMADDTQGRAR
jgi:hypothetical protein